ncbi:MBL fold metallo-hydrolase [Kocuria dechangensis]|uniref:MBL fold metallo-hydrolase n=1 Tax=Kocuria dechangensis TaxID=1176249 RepID=A0A917GYS8_9MICC|nr:MBL fold metallo-hydrolase [Kocuria dechangensis]GGG61668.1 MBL fold metallo-hydrolase [Kocuria dechangensis]
MAELDFTLVGGPTAVFTLGGVTFMTDPTFDDPCHFGDWGGPPLTKTTGPAVSQAQLPSPDVVLLSHDQHPDNLDEAGRALLPEAGTVFSTPEAAGRIPGVKGLAPWETAQVTAPGGRVIHVTAVPARHGPEGCEPIAGTVTGFVLHGSGLPTVYVSGDNAAVELVEQIADRFPDIDVAILFTGAARLGIFDDAELTLTAAGAVEVARLLPAARIVPVHAEGWAHFTESFADLQEAFTGAGLTDRLLVAGPGATLAVG